MTPRADELLVFVRVVFVFASENLGRDGLSQRPLPPARECRTNPPWHSGDLGETSRVAKWVQAKRKSTREEISGPGNSTVRFRGAFFLCSSLTPPGPTFEKSGGEPKGCKLRSKDQMQKRRSVKLREGTHRAVPNPPIFPHPPSPIPSPQNSNQQHNSELDQNLIEWLAIVISPPR